jgi:CheY-like chemotaxis protein
MRETEIAHRDPETVRILLLDEDPFMLRLLTFQLAQRGYLNVIACNSGASALEQLSAPGAAVDLIFLDVNMPRMDGIELIGQLVGCRFAGSVVLVSGESRRLLESAEKLLRAHKLTALGNLQKPAKAKELAAVMGLLKPRVNRIPRR